MPRPLSPSEALTSLENALCLIRLKFPDRDFDERLYYDLRSLYAPFLDILGARELLDAADLHVLSMFKARDENNLELAEFEREAALAACVPLKEIIIKHKLQ